MNICMYGMIGSCTYVDLVHIASKEIKVDDEILVCVVVFHSKESP